MTEIEKLTAAYAASTQGTWEDWPSANEDDPAIHRIDVLGAHPTGGDLIAAWVAEHTDAEFVALAHNMMPKLLEAVDALQRIKRARDYCAKNGEYPPEYGISGDVCFDDWAADISSTVLEALE